MNKPSKRQIAEFCRQLKLIRCPGCRKALYGDPVTMEAVYSCAIENPRIQDYLCACSRLRPDIL